MADEPFNSDDLVFSPGPSKRNPRAGLRSIKKMLEAAEEDRIASQRVVDDIDRRLGLPDREAHGTNVRRTDPSPSPPSVVARRPLASKDLDAPLASSPAPANAPLSPSGGSTDHALLNHEDLAAIAQAAPAQAVEELQATVPSTALRVEDRSKSSKTRKAQEHHLGKAHDMSATEAQAAIEQSAQFEAVVPVRKTGAKRAPSTKAIRDALELESVPAPPRKKAKTSSAAEQSFGMMESAICTYLT